MNFIDTIKELKGDTVKVPERSREELPEFFKEMGYTVGAEVGVYKAGFAERFCKAGLKMFAIDPWMAYQGAGRPLKEQERQNFLYDHATRVLRQYEDCTIIRSTSMDALKYFEDGSLDFVYIDGDHSFKHFAEDIVEWSKKVRVGGIVSGHDYSYFGPSMNTSLIIQVGPVVDAYVKVMEIDTLYTFGKNPSDPDKDNRYNSWMYIKK